jgi:transcriptional regulator with XRE-family HTH domain
MARDICVALGERIRELRLKRGWRQIDFAEETGMHENYVLEFRIIPRRNGAAMNFALHLTPSREKCVEVSMDKLGISSSAQELRSLVDRAKKRSWVVSHTADRGTPCGGYLVKRGKK